MRSAGPSTVTQTAAPQWQARTGLLAVPDDVLQHIIAPLKSAEPLLAIRNLQRVRASCKELQQRIGAPEPAVVLDLKYQRSASDIRAVVMNDTLDSQQAEVQVRALYDRYGDVRVVLSTGGRMPRTIMAMGDLLAKNTTLASLDLSCCGIGDGGLVGLAQGLQKNSGLRHLSLGQNGDLTSRGFSALAGALKTHPSITSLDLRGMRIDRVSSQALAQGLQTNHPTLESLDLSGCAT